MPAGANVVVDDRIQIEGCRILEVLGRGSMGRVYLGRQIAMDRPVAVKVLSPQMVERDPRFADQFLDEARTAARFDHPHIVRVHDAGTTTVGGRDLPYFVMEYVDGEDLAGLLRREGRADPAVIGRVMRAMASALRYAARQGVVHRDIKPANIMLTAEGDPKLADFGVAHRPEEGADRRVVGTPAYMSPEAARGAAVDHTADQYSLGCTLYHLLTGERPYRGSPAQMREQHTAATVPLASDAVDCDRRWAGLAQRLMAKRPCDRFTDPEGLVAAVERILGGEVASAPPPRPITGTIRRSPPGKRRPARGGRGRTGVAERRRTGGARAAKRSAGPESAASPPSPTFREGLGDMGRTLAIPGRALWRGVRAAVSWTQRITGRYLPMLRRGCVRLVPILAPVYLVPTALSWRVRVVHGQAELAFRRDDRSCLVAVVAAGRRLPGVWRLWDALDGRRGWRLLFDRRALIEGLQRGLDRCLTLGRGPAARLQRRLARSPVGRGVVISVGAGDGLAPDTLAVLREAGASVLPVACSTASGRMLGAGPRQRLVPAPFATVALAIGHALPVVEAEEGELQRVLGAELDHLQARCDHMSGLVVGSGRHAAVDPDVAG